MTDQKPVQGLISLGGLALHVVYEWEVQAGPRRGTILISLTLTFL